MAAGTRSRREDAPDARPHEEPEISSCRSSPETVVFLESGNTDGWIASDLTVDVRR